MADSKKSARAQALEKDEVAKNLVAKDHYLAFAVVAEWCRVHNLYLMSKIDIAAFYEYEYERENLNNARDAQNKKAG